MRRRWPSLAVRLGLVMPVLVGCPVDNRLLNQPTQSAGHSGDDSNAGDDGASPGAPSAGEGGSAGRVFDDSPQLHGAAGTDAPGDDHGGEGGMGEQGGRTSAGTAGIAGSSAGQGGVGALAGAGGIGGIGGLGGIGGIGGATLGGAGSGAGQGGVAGSAAGGRAAGGFAGSSPIVCGDIDLNGLDDCSETVARNSRFNHDVTDWQSEYGVAKTWSAEDAGDKTDSGAIAVTFSTNSAETGASMAGVSQCLPSISMGFYQVGAQAFIPSGQAGGWAAVNLFFYSGDDCSGTLVNGSTLRLEQTPNTWLTIAGDVHVPPDARSMALRLVAVKPGGQGALNVLFDNVLLRRE